SQSIRRATLRRVQIRRWAPTTMTQALQRAAHRLLQAGPLSSGTDQPAATSLPILARLLQRFPILRAIPAILVGRGVLPEHAPRWAMSPGSRR
ncbi:MAG TPA: hypothetical protein VEX88_14960, partial [Glaciibacter sp.]|nr:hypothetical protein [Glaciibacter sp.]